MALMTEQQPNLKRQWRTPELTTVKTVAQALLCFPSLPLLCASGECVSSCNDCLDNTTCGPG